MSWQKLVNNLWVQYTALALAVLLPLLLPGYILTLDLVFTPQLAWPSELSNVYLFEAVLHVLNLILPSQVIEKLLLLAILVLSAVGVHKLILFIAKRFANEYLYWGAYFAGMFYMINPFVYSRFMAGQYMVLLGYALTPFFVMAFIKLMMSPGWRNALMLALWTSLIVGVSLHHAGMLLLMGVATTLAMAWSYRKQLAHIKSVAVYGAVSLGVALLVNAYWLVPTAVGETAISQATSNFGVTEYEAFAANDQGPFGALGNVLRLQGFWADAREMYVLPQQLIPAWGLVVIAIWTLVIIGLVRLWRTNRSLAIALSLSAIGAVVVSTTPIVTWLAGFVPFVSGYREPQKFVAILALVYALSAGFGVAALLKRLSIKRSKTILTAVVCVVLVLPIFCTPTMLWGFNGQLAPRDYPADWYAVNDALNRDATVSKVLFLPWHQYLGFSFANRIIANPAPKFFDKPTVAGDNPEYKNIQPTVPNDTNRRIEQEILANESATNLGSRLGDLGFTHVILAKEYDYQDYDYLNNQPDLKLLSDTATLKLYVVLRGANHAL